jgi:hypothetical protein
MRNAAGAGIPVPAPARTLLQEYRNEPVMNMSEELMAEVAKE